MKKRQIVPHPQLQQDHPPPPHHHHRQQQPKRVTFSENVTIHILDDIEECRYNFDLIDSFRERFVVFGLNK
jgi:hypothetical protein